VSRTVKIGLELVAHRPVEVRLGTFFETWIATAGGCARRSLGRDEYHLRLAIAPGGRLAATGRTHICQVDLEAAGLGPNGARQALLAPVPWPGDQVLWGIRTNCFLDPADLRASARARLLTEGGRVREFDFADDRVDLQVVAPGRYLIDVTRLLAE